MDNAQLLLHQALSPLDQRSRSLSNMTTLGLDGFVASKERFGGNLEWNGSELSLESGVQSD